MNARSAVFAVLSIKPHKISELIEKLPYSHHTIYKTLELLAEEGLVTKRKEKGKVVVETSKNYNIQKLKEIYIKALTYGIDPEILLRKSSLIIWGQLEKPKTLKELQNKTGLSYPWVRNVVIFLVNSNLAKLKKRKPIIVILNSQHELNILIKKYTEKKDDKDSNRIYYESTIPFEKLIKTPTDIEEILYKKIDGSLTIKDTGLTIRGKDKLSVVESVEQTLSPERFFLKEIKTLEGVEDFCIRLIASKKLNYDRLLYLAKEMDLINIVGCYLNIINDLKKIVGSAVIEKFQKNISKRKFIFLKSEKKYGKGGWEDKYEGKWNVDLYLDLGTIRHGVRSI